MATPSKTDGSTLVAIVIDTGTYAALGAEIERYAQDVRQNLGAQVVIAARDWSGPEAIRAHLQDLRAQGLIGAVLIGELPATFFYARLQDVQLERVPTDYYYMELDSDLVLDGNRVFERPTGATSLLADIWVGRLKPTKGGSEGLDQLRRYLDRNHAYRTGKLEYVQEMLILDDIGSGQSTESESSVEATDVERVVGKTGLYRLQDTVLPGFMAGQKDVQDLAQALQRPYEFAYLNHHGTPSTQQFGQTTLAAADIERIDPKPLFYLIWACSNGDFTDTDYLAGIYLFEGNGLAVFAPTVPVLGNIESGIPFLYPLSLGATLGASYQYTNFFSPMVLLGDPTLAIRRTPDSAPVLQLQQTELDFGEVPVVDNGALILGSVDGAGSQAIEAFNEGQEPLLFSAIPSFVHFVRDGQWETEPNNPISFIFPDRIAPGQSGELSFTLSPSQPGEYNGFVAFYTNDPRRTLVVVPFRGVARGEGESRVVPGSDAADTPDAAAAPDTSNPLVLVGGCAQTADILAMEGSKSARPQEAVYLDVLVSPSEDLVEAQVRFDLPEGVNLVNGDIEWTGALRATDALELEIVVSAPLAGEYIIGGRFEGRTAGGQAYSDCKTLLLIVRQGWAVTSHQGDL